MNPQVAKEVSDNASKADQMIAELAKGNPVEQATPLNQSSEQPKEQPQQISQPKSDDVDYKQRFLVMQGKYNAEVPRYQNEIAQLKDQLATMQANTGEKSKVKAANVEEALTELTQEWGGDFVSHINALVQAEIGNVNKRIDSFESSVTSLTQDQKCQKMSEMLSPLGINFLTTDQNPDFHTWLNSVDELSNQPRQALLSHAWLRGDLERASIFYKQFANSINKTPPNNPLEQHVQVGQTHSGSEQPNQIEPWTDREIAAMYNDFNLGRISVSDKERYEKEIFYAVNQGSVNQSNFN